MESRVHRQFGVPGIKHTVFFSLPFSSGGFMVFCGLSVSVYTVIFAYLKLNTMCRSLSGVTLSVWST